MADMATIGAALGSIKTATEIAKFLRESDISLEKAELKLKLADLVGALADAKMELVEVQENLTSKDLLILELKEAFENKDKLVRRYDAYYTADQGGNAIGIPYCLRCWESDYKKRQLISTPSDRFTCTCTSCGQKYEHRRAAEIQAKATEQGT